MLKFFTILGVFTTFVCSENFNNHYGNQNSGIDVAFIRLGKYRGDDDEGYEYQKSYFLSRYLKADWGQAKAICKAFDLELASFETITEAHTFLSMCEKSSDIPSSGKIFYLTDGMTVTPRSSKKDNWFWTNSGKKIAYNLPWTGNQPDFNREIEYCLTIGRVGVNETLGFNDYTCVSGIIHFICQKVDFYVH